MRFIVIASCFFLFPQFFLAQNALLDIYDADNVLDASTLPNWITVESVRAEAEVFLEKKCTDTACHIEIQWGDFPAEKIPFSENTIENKNACIAVLARCAADKIRDAEQSYSIDPEATTTRADFSKNLFDLWLFSAQASGILSNTKVYEPLGLNPEIEIRPRRDFTLNGTAYRMGSRWRFLASFDYSAFYRRNTILASNIGNPINWIQGVSGEAQVGMRITEGLSAGFGAKGFANVLSNSTNMDYHAGLEYNFLPYEDFFRRRFIVGWAVFEDEAFQLLSTVFSNDRDFHQSLFLKYGIFRSWGFVDCQIRYFRHLLPQDEVNSTLNALQPTLAYGVNLSSALFLQIEATAQITKESRGSVQVAEYKSRSFSSTIGIQYFFGKGGRNVVNPRMF